MQKLYDRTPGGVEPRAHSAKQKRVRAARYSALRLTLESALIVLSVLFAFGLNEWRTQRAERVLATNVLTGFRQEIESNLALLEVFQPQHAQFAEALGRLEPESTAGRTGMEVGMSLRPNTETVTMPLAEAAWQTAVSTGALRLLDYHTASMLSRIYLMQRDAVGSTVERLTSAVFDARMFDAAATLHSLPAVGALLSELAAQEASLMGEYRAALAHLADPES
jgi:hypothetical protein